MGTDVKDFYDSFRDKRMVKYRVDGSRRIDAAHRFATGYLADRKTIADIGCGIGIFAEMVGHDFPDAKIVAVDLSEKNIEFAKKTVDAKNVVLSAASVTEQFSVLRDLSGGPVEAFCMIDVIEHIPAGARPALLQDMAEIAADGAVLILAYPSPEYQRHLMANNREELQIIDNVVEIDALIAEAYAAGWRLHEFRYVDMWMTNQYVHAAFNRRLDLVENVSPMPVAERVRLLFDRVFLRPGRLKRYGAKDS